MSLLTSWSPFFQNGIRMKGRALQMAGQVHFEPPNEDELVRAYVRTEGEDRHTVTLHAQGEDAATASCDCGQFAHGRFCPHIWAAVLAVRHAEGDAPGASAGDLARRTLRPPKAGKRAKASAGRKPARSAEPRWMGRLSLLRPNREELDEAVADLFPVQRQVCYVVRPRLSTRHNGVVVELRQRVAIASGWSRPKPLKIGAESLSSLADPVDRELCALMLGAVWVSERESANTRRPDLAHTTYRIPEGAARTILRQMIDTGRCFFDLGENEDDPSVPLVWDPQAGPPANREQKPWRLCLYGTLEEASGDLRLDLQVRRLGRWLTVDEPALVLGGPDGMVFLHDRGAGQALAGPFDDRDALRWVSQFRDPRYAEEGPRTMTVAKAEVPRFLERLYMLPHLPEIDLPEELGRAEEQVDPIPRVDFFSPGSAEARDLLPSSNKTQMVARLWFEYGRLVVNPTQPGRFLTLTPPEEQPAAENGGDGEGENEGGGEGAPEEQRGDDSAPGPESAATGTGDGGGGEDASARRDPAPSGVAVAGERGDPEDESEPNDEGAADRAREEDDDVPPAATPEGGRLIRRAIRAEREAIAVLGTLGLRHLTGGEGNALAVAGKRVSEVTGELLSRGWRVHADRRIVRTAGPPNLSIASGIDWFELRGSITFTREDGQEEEVPLPRILAAARAGSSMIELGDGSQGLLPEQWMESHGLLTSLGKLQGDHLRFKSSQAAVLDALLGDHELVHFDDRFAQAREKLHRFEGIEELAPADRFGGDLRPYQREGLGWLSFLRWFGMGGVLADDMGLGKTIQLLAMLQARKLGLPGHLDADAPDPTGGADSSALSPHEHRPSLIVVPRSVVFNWVDEARKFTPDLGVIAYTGPDRARLLPSFPQCDVVITSYGLMRRDAEALGEIDFDYVVLDEAQAIKNPASQSAKAARLLRARHRIALTGTPIENHLGDLWSIFEFLNPGMLGASSRFSELVRGAGSGAKPAGGGALGSGGPDAPATGPGSGIEAQGGEDQSDADDAQGPGAQPRLSGEKRTDPLTQVAAALRPFILRRTKKQVLTDLPRKTEQTIVCEMEPAQRKVYDQLRQYYRGTLLQQLDTGGDADAAAAASGTSGGGGGQAFMVLEALLRLRQAACHPALIGKDEEGGSKHAQVPSAKLDALEDRLADVIDEGSKALVFSQFTSMLALIRQRLDARGIRYAYLDGQTRNRREVVERFQEDPQQQVFLISLKAGGVGLNLTAAEYVFIMDPWWNPAVEQQAIDRTHRIGQTKPVFAYRLVCEDTVEQRILDLQSRKRHLADAIVGGEENLLRSLTREDLEQLLA